MRHRARGSRDKTKYGTCEQLPMTHKDSGWRPKGANEKYNGFEVWDHGVWPNEVNVGEVDGEIRFDFLEREKEEEG